MRVFEAEDDGDLGKLASVSVPKQVAVKVGCPVILTVNLSDELVNGLAGEVRAITHDTVDVYFESLKRRVTLKPFSFTVYDANKKIDVACRTQFPIRLAFALTVHKAQGLTVDRISIDCTQMYQFGQIAVAISRCTTKKGLHITNFSKRLLRNPPGIILEFYGKEQYLPKVDWSCCKKHVPEVLETCSQEYEELFTPFEDITETLSDDDTEAMIGLVDLMEDESEETTVEYKLPDTFSVSAILENIKSIGETEQQIQENQVITVMKNSENTQKLVKYLWNSFYSLKEKFFKNKEGLVTENKTVSDFYKAVHVIMSESTAAPLREKAVETAQTERGQEFPESDGGRGKIRYIGGWCISQIRKKKVSAISKLLYKPNKTDTVRELKCELKCLQQVVDSESFLAEHSTDKGSLLETRRKQNVRSGLTNITDDAQNFFMMLDKKVRQLETTANLNVHGASFDMYMQTQLRTDNVILCTFSKLFNPMTPGDTCKKLLSEVLSKYCIMSLGQLRKTYLKEVQTTKTEAHRKQIKMRGKGRKVDSIFNFDAIKEDTTEHKKMSHKRLQYEVMKTEDYLINFTKGELHLLCIAYGITARNYKTKAQISTILKQCIINSANMSNPSALDKDEEKTVEDIEKVSSSSIPIGKEGGKLSTKRKIVNKAKGGGKKKSKKSVCKYPCGVCRKECSWNVVGCDGCDTWYHADCIQVEDLDELPDEWICNTCKDELDNM
ncbi:PIF1 [Mytilus coruscus]|uniref:PIF1 n=1 Tax=Mytilus coruscus TaxID=42192 RepID=A0A6J8C4B2_MYTCO|nr:PIF1 [Mytilus coruscus]